MESDSNWTDYFLDLNEFVHKQLLCLEKGHHFKLEYIEVDSCFQVSTVCKAKQALKAPCDMLADVTDASFYSIPLVLKVHFLTWHQNPLGVCVLRAIYMQS